MTHTHSHDHDHHHEEHLKSSDFITDVVIGMSDGLTVPFALAAGMSSAVFDNHIVTTAGIAEIILGLLLIFTSTRKFAAYGIFAMLITFIPAHVYFIQIGSCIPNGLCVPQWLGWVRLIVLHPLLIAWAAWYRK